MAQSLTEVSPSRSPKPPRPRLPRNLPEVSIDDLLASARTNGRRVADRMARHWRHDPALLAWQVGTAPLWLGSGIPSPDRPVLPMRHGDIAERADILDNSVQGAWLAEQVHGLTRRFWLAWMTSAILRGIALGAIACTLWTLGAIQGALPQPRMVPFIAIVILGGTLGLAFGLVNRPSVTRIAAMLDRTFDLHERMITAFTAAPADLTPRIRSIQLADAANAFEEIRQDVRGAAVLPLREMVIAALAGIALVTALLFNIASTGIPETDPIQIPVFVPSSERFAREAQEQKAQQLADAAQQPPAAISPETTPGESASAGTLGGLRAVGNALGTNAVTEPSASRIAQGDFPGAQDQLEQSAQAAANLPQAERGALADELDGAAKGMEDGDLKDATQKAADGLREGGDAAVTGLNDLADQIGESGEQATTQGQPSESGQTSSSSQASGQSSSASQSGQSGQDGQSGQRAQTGDSGTSQDGGASGQAPQGDPGSGVAAAPGIGSDPAERGQEQPGNDGSGGSSQRASGQTGQAGQAGQAGQQGQASSGSSSQGGGAQSGAPSGESGSTGQTGEKGSSPNGSETGGSQGGGASGSTSPTDPGAPKSGGGSGNGNEEDPSKTAQDGKASDNPPPGSDQQASGAGDTSQPVGGNETLVLQGTSDDDGVSTGGNTGSSSAGSGSGAGAASGSASQGTVGPAGPDRNRVPDRYRQLVKDYFDGDGFPSDEDQP
ncbi:MAG: hypothetical protein QM753_18495 [Thermomicrobiales bacterium]